MLKSLHRAYRLREKSDYQPVIDIDKKDCEEMLREAREFIIHIESVIKKG